ncbi:MAG: hypothetical protein NXI32_04165 [bacterium]|nr:hypothetical protein [bacterium]
MSGKLSTTLVIVPCGSAKVWNRDPEIGPTIAKDAYIGAPFKVNRQYAEKFGSRWVILSAKYGFIDPDYLLPGPYEVTFKKKATGPIETKILAAQVVDRKLDQFDRVVGLGGKEYRIAIKEAYSASKIESEFPFAGLPIGKAMRVAKIAIET